MSTIKNYIQQLITEGGDQNFLIINLKNGAYLQLAAEKGSQKIYIEVSGSNPKTNFLLSSKQIEELKQLDWTIESSPYHNNYSKNITLSDTQDIEVLEHLIHLTASIFETTFSAYSYNLCLE
ncbi:MAG: hypothetical protein ACI976_001065 [Aureispira sp.]|jgi:hypothetical protein